MPSQKRASDLRKGDKFELPGNVQRIAIVQRIAAIEAADLLPEDCRKFCPPRQLLQIEIFTPTGNPSRAFPGIRLNYWSIWREPDDLMKMAV